MPWYGRLANCWSSRWRAKVYLSCTASTQKRPSSATNRNPPKPCTPAARWNGLPSRRNRAEPQCFAAACPSQQRAVEGPTTKLALARGPKVRIHLPPAESLSLSPSCFRGSRTAAFRAAVRGWLGNRVGRDAQERPPPIRRPRDLRENLEVR